MNGFFFYLFPPKDGGLGICPLVPQKKNYLIMFADSGFSYSLKNAKQTNSFQVNRGSWPPKIETCHHSIKFELCAIRETDVPI